MARVLAFVLAGGKGTRLYPLTKERAKPAVPFGGRYRIVDFVLSNLINSGIYSTYVLIQFRSQSLLQHLSEGWATTGLMKEHFIIPVPAQMRSREETWYRGTADALYQNVNLIEQANADYVVVFGADHIYRMNIREMVEFHAAKGAKATVAAIPVERKWASEFGVIEAAADGRIVGFHEKRADAPTIPGDPKRVYASMGNYVFSAATLLEELHADAATAESAHDFGRNILPSMVGRSDLYAYDFQTNRIPGDPPEQEPYWRDVGTIEAYYDASMDLRAVSPALNLYNRQWPLRTSSYSDAPAKFIFDEQGRRGQAIDSIVAGGSILSGGMARGSVLGRNVRVHSGSVVEDSVLFDNVNIGRRARVRRAILDKNVQVAEGDTIGFDIERDRQRYHVTESGIVVVEGHRSPVDVLPCSAKHNASSPLYHRGEMMRHAKLVPIFVAALWATGCSSKTTDPSVTTTSEGQQTVATAGSNAAYHDTALIRFFNADPHQPTLDIVAQDQPLFSDTAYKSITSYKEAARGVTQFAIRTGSSENLATTRRELFPGRHYSLIALPSKKHATRLESFSDDLGKIDPDEARVRLINATTGIDDLDLYVQGTGTRVLHGSGSGDVVSFAEMYAATVEIRPGKKAVPKAFSNLVVEPGRLYTFVAVDDGGSLDVVEIVDRLEP